MEHLTRDDMLAWVEGARDAGIEAHLSACAACHDEVAALDAVRRAVAQAPVPEPSPLFWDHFSRSVRERIDAGETVPASWTEHVLTWRWRRALATVAPLAVAALVLAAAGPALYRLAKVSPSPVSGEMPALTSDMGDEPWETVVGLVEAYASDEAGATPAEMGLEAPTLSPGSAERAAAELSDAESRELARLLRLELGQE